MPERPIPYRSPPDCIFLLFMVINSGKVNKNTKYMGAYSSKLFQLYLLSIKGGQGAFFKTTSCQITNFKHFSLKNVVFYLNGGQGACPLKLKHLCKHIHVKRGNLQPFTMKGGLQQISGNISQQRGSGGLPPEAEAFLVNLGVQWKTFVTFYPERGSPTNIWKYIIAKGVKLKHFL